MSLRATVEPEDTPLREGQRRALSLSVTNASSSLLVLDEARGDGPHDERLRWRRQPEGIVVYDAAEDLYRYHAHIAARAHVPLCVGVVQPGATLGAFLQVRSMLAGPRRLAITITGHLLPPAEAAARVYVSPERLQGATTLFRPLPDLASAHGAVIARVHGAERVETRVELSLEVAADPDSPSSAALARAGAGASIIDRVRRLGGAWVVEAPDGAVTVAAPGRALRLSRGAVDATVWRRLDDAPANIPVPVMFKSDRARALRDSGAVALEGLDTAQQVVQVATLWDLLAACEERGLSISFGRHSPVTDGLLVV